MLTTLIQIVYCLLCVLMIGVVLMQRSEGDGVAGMLGGGGQAEAIFGTKTGNVLAKFTTGLGVILFVLIIALTKMTADSSVFDGAPALKDEAKSATEGESGKQATPDAGTEGAETPPPANATETQAPAAPAADVKPAEIKEPAATTEPAKPAPTAEKTEAPRRK